MDFGVGFLSNNVMLPILDFFYGIVPSYGLAIIALTLVVRFALYPISAGSIRSMRRMKITQPIMQKKIKDIQERYKNDPAKQQEELSAVYKEFGNPLAGCFPILVQMPVLIALFTTLRGSPFADVPYSVNLQILPQEQIERVQPEAFATPPKNIYISDSTHYPVVGLLPGGTRLAVGDTTKLEFQTPEGKTLNTLATEAGGDIDLSPKWQVMKGAERVQLGPNGEITALQPGDVTLQGTIPGLAASKGFLFISALGHVGAVDDEGIHWDIVAMVLLFGLSLYVSQSISSQGATDNPQQAAANKLTPIIFSGMFLFFPLPAGVLMYMVVANLFQTAQAFILSREPLPENIQKMAEAQGIVDVKAVAVDGATGRLPFEPKSAKASSPAKNQPSKGPGNKPSTNNNKQKGKS
ncbi:membrane protein insertase YidC [Limnothrix redekei]|uniref:Membrane protein insertase YidC n=1 Tax=Limnothrix redekei LRLZ20PSL1 TaxID=3112953 RepID=A0ABW7C749_9CYAN